MTKMNALFRAIDQRPFRPFVLELVSGQKVKVSHPDNIFVLPNRESVHHVEVFQSGLWLEAIIWPDSIAALLFNGKKARAR